jgi:RND family efflux transporter MFP subunit
MNLVLKAAAGPLVALCLGLQIGPAWAESAAPKPGPGLAPVVSVVEAVGREIVESAVVTGTLVPRDEILVTPEVDGFRITEVLVEEGMQVERGQVLARLSRDLIDRQIAQQNALVDRATAAVPQAENNIQQAEATELEARLAFERAKQLGQTGNSTAVVLESRTAALRQAESRVAFTRNGLIIAKAELAQARAVRDELQLRLARTDIRAPEAGIVNRRAARVGMTASASAEPLFRIIARGEIELEGEIIGSKLPLLKAGTEATIDMEDGESIRGSVRAVYPEIDKATRLGKVRVQLPRDPRLRIGAFVRGTVVIARNQGVTVPQAAVLYGGERRSTVLVVTDGRVEAREVRTGLGDDDDIEIRSGLTAGDAVVARAGSFLRNGDRVRAVPAAKPTNSVEATSSLRATAEAAR